MNKVREELLCRYPFYQPVEGYRYSMDALLLAGFVREERSFRNKDIQCLDIGTGSGIITLLLSKRFPNYHYSAVEIQEELGDIAKENFALHHLKVNLIHGDYHDLEGQDRYHLILSNPPFFKGGSISQNKSQAIARHELHATMETLVAKSKKLLKAGGFLYLIYPAERLGELFALLEQNKIRPFGMKLIYPRPQTEAELVLVVGKKNYRGSLKVLAPFYVYETEEVPTRELDRLYQEDEIQW